VPSTRLDHSTLSVSGVPGLERPGLEAPTLGPTRLAGDVATDRSVVDHSDTDRSVRMAEMMARYLGERVMEAFADDDVTEVYVNPQDGRLRLDTRSRGKVDTGWPLPAGRVEQFLNAVADLHGLTLDAERPSIQAELPQDRFRGARLQGFRPPLASAASFVVRKPPSVVYPLDEYARQGILPADGAVVLRRAVEERWNVLVAGGTGSGKTTLANAVLQEITDRCPHDRIVILEDTVELQCAAPDHLALRTTPDVTLADLVRQTLRAYPDRIVVGEVRGPEALDLLDAWSTGHPGGLGTFHAQDARSALMRLDRLCQRANVPSQAALVAEAVDLVVVIAGGHGGAGSSSTRRVCELARVRGLRSDGTYDLESLLSKQPLPKQPLPAQSLQRERAGPLP
jgi:type IV secretion system protein VirB11